MTSKTPRQSPLAIDKRSVPDQVADVLMRRIISGTFMPGDRIIESHVAEGLGVAQSSVREALRKLELIGVVEHKRYTGVVVKVSDPDNRRLAIPIRAKVEEVAIVEAMRNNIDVGPLRDMVQAMLDAKDFDASTDTHAAFHHYIFQATGHTMLTELWDLMIWRTSTLFLHGKSKEDLDPWTRSHYQIIDFLEAGDPTGAEQLALDHVAGKSA